MHTDHRFVLRRAHGKGHGLFARVPVRRGDFIMEYTGRRITTAEADALRTRYLFEIDRSWTIDGSARSNRARYINHSCDPNCEAEIRDGRIMLYAAQDIAAGEELSFDYGDEYFDEFIRSKGCRCGTRACRSRRTNEET
jgi:SET domain-containing protein